MDRVSIVIPAWNESFRLPRTLRLLEQAIAIGEFAPFRVQEVIIVDDGSKDGTAELCLRFADRLPGLKIHRHSLNLGRGASIRTGLELAESHWVLVADADRSTPWAEASRLIRAASVRGAALAVGSRRLRRPGQRVSARFSRRAARMVFNWTVRLITPLGIKDTQCGFKVLNSVAVKRLLPQMREDRYAWDIELLMLARRAQVPFVEVAVDWTEVEGRKIRPIRDNWETLNHVLALKRRMNLGQNELEKT